MGYDLFLLGCWINVILIMMLLFRNMIIILICYIIGGLFYNLLLNIIFKSFFINFFKCNYEFDIYCKWE